MLQIKLALYQLLNAVAVWRSCNCVGRINGATLRRARFYTWMCDHFWQVTQPPAFNGMENGTDQSAAMLCGWELKTGWLIPFVDTCVDGR